MVAPDRDLAGMVETRGRDLMGSPSNARRTRLILPRSIQPMLVLVP